MEANRSSASRSGNSGWRSSMPLVCAAAEVPTLANVVAVVATASAFGFSAFRARHAHDLDDLDF